jgi:hypothetical protein
MAHSSLRFGIGRFTTEAEIDYVVRHIVGTVQRLRDMRQVSERYLYLCPLSVPRPVRCGRWSRKGSILTPLTGHNIKSIPTWSDRMPVFLFCTFDGFKTQKSW